jgi:hypothetical protein
VVAAFMLGLGFGSLFGGWLLRRRKIPTTRSKIESDKNPNAAVSASIPAKITSCRKPLKNYPADAILAATP